jgi:transcriptional regulator with PAS, ATPase and Fis domain
VARLTIPSLRERREDIPYLVEWFVQRFNAKRGKQIAGVTPAVMEVLMRHDFPGNVRELENIIEYGFVLCHDGLIDVRHLPEELQPDTQHSVTASHLSPNSKLKWAEADVIRSALTRSHGSVGKAAEELGISRTTLWRKMKSFGVSAEDYRRE